MPRKGTLLRVYKPGECGKDGYPLAWHKGEPAIKGLVRDIAGHRCVRCLHPYTQGQHGNGEWSPCDERCKHWGPTRHAPGVPIPRDEQAVDRGILVREGATVEASWRILTVHHLTGEKADCRWWNLAALCQRCHLQIQGRVCMGQVYPFEHSDWFKPYAAGYYAATYLGEDLTREETDARLDDLLALECAPSTQEVAG